MVTVVEGLQADGGCGYLRQRWWTILVITAVGNSGDDGEVVVDNIGGRSGGDG